MAKPIKYALTSDPSSSTGSGALTRPGAATPWNESPDNPMSPHFVALEDRGPIGQARFWAAAEKRKNATQRHGQFDP